MWRWSEKWPSRFIKDEEMEKTEIKGMYNEPIEGLHNNDSIINTPWFPDVPHRRWNEWGWQEPQPTYIYKYIEKEPEEKSELVKDYCQAILTDEEKLAVEMGAMDGVGLLTFAGKELLIEIFNDNEEVQRVFYDTLKKMNKDKKEKKNGEQRASRSKSGRTDKSRSGTSEGGK